MSNRNHHYKPSSHSHRSDDDRTRTTNPTQLSSRTVIYEEATSVSSKTLKSSVRQVVQTSSFYDTSSSSSAAASTAAGTTSSTSRSLTVGSGKQSRPIDEDLYHSEIFDEDDDQEEREEGEMDCTGEQQDERPARRSHRHDSDEKRSKRRRHHHSSNESSISNEGSDHSASPSSSSSKRGREKRSHSFKERRSTSEEGEESISAESDDQASKEQRQTVAANVEGKNSSNDDRSHSNQGDERDDDEEEEEEERVSSLPQRSRFDDHDEDEDNNNNNNNISRKKNRRDDDSHGRAEDDEDEQGGEEEVMAESNRHKRSRRRSSSTRASSSSRSVVTTPLSHYHQVEQEPIREKPSMPNYYPAIQGCRRVDEYKCLNRIEEGTYGVVFRARDIKSGEIVALKRLKMEKEKEGFPITSLREICCILKSQHENVCTVREIVVGDDMNRIFIVMDYVEHDLKSLMTHTMKKPFSIGEVKTLLHQLLSGVNHLHDNWIIHRDLKTSNLLLSNKGILKIGDFGLAREYGSPLKPYTPVVVTLWYRAPELLLGIKEYSTPIDIWSVGTIFGELLLMNPLFPGKSEPDQLNRIFKDLGTPNDKIWPDYSSLPLTKKMPFSSYPYNRLRARFDAAVLSEGGFDLLNKFLAYDPSRRISAFDASKHSYFDETPRRIDPSMFPTWPSRNEEKEKSSLTGVQRSSGSNTTTQQNEPKPPSAGKMYKKLLGGDDDDSYSIEQNLPPPSGFQLRG